MKKKENNLFFEIYGRLYFFFGPQLWWPAKSRFEVIVGAILTQNTSWSNVELAIEALRKVKLLDPVKIQNVDIGKLTEAIRPSGYFNQKAKRLKNFTDFLFKRFGGSLKYMFKTETSYLRRLLLEIHGIGEETADCILLYAGFKPVFVIDAYTRRIFTRLGLITFDEAYASIQKKFTANLQSDEKLFNEYHALIVALGKSICIKKNPICEKCPLQESGKSKAKERQCRKSKNAIIVQK